MNYVELDNEMEMPCPCQKCGKWFDLNDGVGSKEWYPNTVICSECGALEQEEIDYNNEIEELESQISDCEDNISGWQTDIDDAKNTINECENNIEYELKTLENANNKLAELLTKRID